MLFGKIDLSPFIYPMMTMITSLVGGCISPILMAVLTFLIGCECCEGD